jgi:hypothetical protein
MPHLSPSEIPFKNQREAGSENRPLIITLSMMGRGPNEKGSLGMVNESGLPGHLNGPGWVEDTSKYTNDAQ